MGALRPPARPGARLLLALLTTACQPGGLPGQSPAEGGAAVAPRTVYAVVPGTTSLAQAPDGGVLAATDEGSIVEIRDRDRDGVADTVERLMSGLATPLAVAVTPEGRILLAGPDRVVSVGAAGELRTVLPQGILPEHDDPGALRPVPGPDGRIYVGVPAACRTCRPNRFAGSVLRMRPDGHELSVFAGGLGAPKGMGWHGPSGNLLIADRGAGELSRATVKVVQKATAPALYDGAILTSAPTGLPLTRTSVGLLLEPGATPTDLVVLDDGAGRSAALLALAGSGPPDFVVPPALLEIALDDQARPGPFREVIGDFGAPGRPPEGRPSALLPLEDGSILVADDVAGLIWRLPAPPP